MAITETENYLGKPRFVRKYPTFSVPYSFSIAGIGHKYQGTFTTRQEILKYYMKKLFSLFAMLFLLGCSQKASETLITGTGRTLAGQTVYLKKYSHFDYLEGYVIDSTVVAPDGTFSFSLRVNEPQLLTIAKTNYPPATYMVLRSNPDDYYYSFCEKFFGFDPLFYVEQGKNYNMVHWNKEEDEVTYGDKRHNLLRKYYKDIDWKKDLRDENREPLQIDAGKAWEMVSVQRDSILVEYDLRKEFENESFENYMKTEIELGAINEFLLWNYHQSENPLEGEQLDEIMETYNAGNWNPKSIELYKLTERYISHQMNKQEGKNLYYYEPGEEKIAMAEKYADSRIREKVIRNLKILQEQKVKQDM